MISDLFFLARMAVITAVLVITLQVNVGSQTIEQHSAAWLQQSPAAATLRDVAKGAVVFLKSGAENCDQLLARLRDMGEDQLSKIQSVWATEETREDREPQHSPERP